MASMLAEAIVDKFELEKESIREMDLELLLGAVRILFKNFSKQGGEK